MYNLNPEPAQTLRWSQAIASEMDKPEEPVLIVALRRSWNSAARPVLARGIDKQEYVVKGQQAGRQIINDRIVATLGMAMNAPVGEPRIVEISDELLAEEPHYRYLTPGTAHATVFIPGCSDDREPIQYAIQLENQARFAAISILSAWIHGNDLQFIYRKIRPNLVYSVDHGHFFPGGPNWKVEYLSQALEIGAEIDRRFLSLCQLRLESDEIRMALESLSLVEEQTIIKAVASPPIEWGLTITERVSLVNYLLRRQQDLISLL